MDRQPALYGLQVFETAARHRSFQQAAAELGVTPGAVSRQIIALEQTLGIALFERGHRSVTPTVAGASYADDIKLALRDIRAATDNVRATRNVGPIILSVAPNFAMRWLMPRLAEFYNVHPDVSVQIATTLAHRSVSFDRMKIDAAIVVSQSPLLGVSNHRLQPIAVTPVCSPSIKLKSFGDLNNVRLLHAQPRPHDWARWLDFVGEREIKGAANMTFDSQNLSIQGAIDGLGVAIGIEALVATDMRRGILKRPFKEVRVTRSAYYLVYPKESRKVRKLGLFVDWLCSVSACD